MLDITKPCSVFMTFENEEGVNRALNYNEVMDMHPEQYGPLRMWLDNHEIEI